MNFQEFKDKYQREDVTEYRNNVNAMPVVSVCVLTYQHISYIKECLEGILMQQTSFSFEILLGEDHSTDGTREICIEYAQKYPDKIRLFLHNRENNILIGGRLTGRFNLLYTLFCSRGKYIAMCEGDDYWTDPLKLQKQFDFLENNPECTLCSHPSRTIFTGGAHEDVIEGAKFAGVEKFSSREIIGGVYIRTVTMLFKSEILKYIPAWYATVAFGDLPLQLICASKGNIGFLSREVMTVYRRGVVGAWSHGKNNYRWYIKRINDHIEIFNLFNKFTGFKYNKLIKKRINKTRIASLLIAQDYCNKLKAAELIGKNIGPLITSNHKLSLSIITRFILGRTIYNKLHSTIRKS